MISVIPFQKSEGSPFPPLLSPPSYHPFNPPFSLPVLRKLVAPFLFGAEGLMVSLPLPPLPESHTVFSPFAFPFSKNLLASPFLPFLSPGTGLFRTFLFDIQRATLPSSPFSPLFGRA